MKTKQPSIALYILTLWSLLTWVPGYAFAETQTLEHQQIEEGGRQYLLSQLAWDPNDVVVTVQYTGGDLELPGGPMELNYRLLNATPSVGRVPVSLEVLVNREPVRKVWLNAQIEGYFDVVRTTRPIPRDQVIAPEDVEMARVLTSQPLRNVVYNPEEVIGFRTVRDLDLGQTLSPFMVKQVPIVKRGDRVMLVAERGSLRITAPGVVKENGFKNATIQVENLQTKKIIYGTVINSKTVNVEF